jgi:hypothetical protein
MSVDPEDQFIDKIKSTLAANGFPEKKVTLPLEKVKAAAEKLNLDLEFVLSRLGMMDYPSTVEGDKILFAVEQEEPAADSNPFGAMGGMADMFSGMDMDSMKGMSQEDLMGQVANMVQNMTPEQQEGIMNMYNNMSDDDKDDLMNKAKDMGVDPQ